MTNELEDWQLALLVEARRFDDPTVVEAAEAAVLQESKDLRAQAEGLERPVVVEYDKAQQIEQAEALLEAANGLDEWEVVEADQRAEEQEACAVVKDLLAEALQERHGLREEVVEGMSAPTMLTQFQNEEDGEVSLEALVQNPETGGAPDSDDDDDGAGGASDRASGSVGLSGDVRQEFQDLRRRARIMADRTPEYAESLRQEAADLAGLDDPDELDDLDMEGL